MNHSYQGWTEGEEVMYKGEKVTISELPGNPAYDRHRFSAADKGCTITGSSFNSWTFLKELTKISGPQIQNKYEIF